MKHPLKKGILMGNTIQLREMDKDYVEYTEYDLNGNKTKETHRRIKCFQMKGEIICDYDSRKGSKKFNHICRFSGKNKNLLELLNDESKKQYEDDDFLTQLCSFISKFNLSYKSVCSDSFYRLIIHIITISRNTSRSIPNESIFRFPNEKDISRFIIEKGKELLIQKIMVYNKKYSSVSIDAGTIAHHNYVVVNIVNPSTKPLLFLLHDSQGAMKKSDYAHLGAKIIDDLMRFNITISSFITDGLKHQVDALSYSEENSFASYIDKSSLVSVPLHSCCLCHLISLSLSKAIQSNQNLTNLVDYYLKLSSYLRNNKTIAIIGVCPSNIETRWMYISRIAKWVIKNWNKLFEFLEADIIQELEITPYFIMILEPYVSLIKAFEEDSRSISDVIPMIIEALNYYDGLFKIYDRFNDPYWIDMINCLKNCLIFEITKSKSFPQYLLAYSLTCFGSMCIKNNEFFNINPLSNPYSNQRPKLSEYYNDPTEIKEFIYRDCEQNDEEIIVYSDEDSEFFGSDSHNTDSEYLNDYDSFDESFDLSMNDEEYVNINEEREVIFENLEMACPEWFNILDAYLYDIASLWYHDEIEIQNILRTFTLWINKDCSIPCIHHLKNGFIDYWESVSNSNSFMKNLSDIALRLFSICTSEASCERVFSKMRDIVGSKRYKLSNDSLFGLLQFHYSNN